MKKIILTLVVFFLLNQIFAQKVTKKLTFKNKSSTVELVHFNKSLSKEQIENYAKKNGYLHGDTSDLKFLLKNQSKLPKHCNVFVFLNEKVSDKDWGNARELIKVCYLETNGSSINIFHNQIMVRSSIYNNHYEEESETPVDHYICFKR